MRLRRRGGHQTAPGGLTPTIGIRARCMRSVEGLYLNHYLMQDVKEREMGVPYVREYRVNPVLLRVPNALNLHP